MSDIVDLPGINSTDEKIFSLSQQKTEAEIRKINAEAASLSRSWFKGPGNWISLVLGFGGLLTAYTQWAVSDLKLENTKLETERKLFELEKRKRELDDVVQNLTSQNTELEKNISEKRDLLQKVEDEVLQKRNLIERASVILPESGLKSELNEAVGDLGNLANRIQREKSLVYLHFKGDISRKTMQQLQDKLKSAGYIVPGIERVSQDYKNEIRYFHDKDRALAQDVHDITNSFFTDQCPLASPPKLTKPNIGAREGLVEVWISHNCP